MSELISTLIEKALRDIPDMDWERIKGNETEITTRFVSGSPPKVAVDLGDGEILVHRWAAEWTHPHTRIDAAKVVGRIDLEAPRPTGFEKEITQAIRHLVLAARILRRMTLIKCQFCDAPTYPEDQYDAETCHSCASSEYGVVY